MMDRVEKIAILLCRLDDNDPEAVVDLGFSAPVMNAHGEALVALVRGGQWMRYEKARRFVAVFDALSATAAVVAEHRARA